MAKQTIQVADKQTLDAILAKMNALTSIINNMKNESDKNKFNGFKAKAFSNSVYMPSKPTSVSEVIKSSNKVLEFTPSKNIVIHAITMGSESSGSCYYNVYTGIESNYLPINNMMLINNQFGENTAAFVSDTFWNMFSAAYGTSRAPKGLYCLINNCKICSISTSLLADIPINTIKNENIISTSYNCLYLTKGIYVPAGKTIKVYQCYWENGTSGGENVGIENGALIYTESE